MAKKISGITIEIGGETTKLGKAMGDVNKDSRDLQKELKGVETLLKFDPTNTVLISQKQEILAQSIENTKKKLELLESTQEQVQKQFDKGEITEQQYRDFQREIVATEQKLEKLETQAESMGDEVKEATDKGADGAEKMGGFFEKAYKKMDAQILMDIGDKLAGMSDKIIGFAKETFDAFGKIDDGLDIIVVKTGASAEAMEDFERINRNLVSSMPIEEISKVGEGIGELNTQFGFLGDELENNTRLAVMFSEINGTDVTSTVISAKQAISAYSLEYSQFGNVLDTVTDVSQKTGVSVDELFKKAVDGAPQIKQLGLEFGEGVTLMGNFEKAGVDSNAMLMALNKASIVYAKENKSLNQGLNESVKAIANAKTETEALQIAQSVFGIRGANKMVDAIKRGEFSLDDLGVAMNEISGKTAQTFEDTLDPIDNMTIASNNMTLAMADMGGVIAETLAPIMLIIANLIKEFATWFGNLNPVVKDAVVIIGAIVAVLGLLAPIIITVTVAVTSLNVALLPIIAVVAGVVVGITALILIIKNWGAITDWIKETWGKFVPWLQNLWEKMKEFGSALWKSIADTISGLVKGVVDFIIGYYTFLFNVVKTIFTTIWNFFATIFTNIKNTMTNMVQGAVDGVVRVWNTLTSTVRNIFGGVASTIRNLLNIDLGQVGKNIIQGLANGISGGIKWVTDAVRGIGNSIMSGFKNFFKIFSPSHLLRDQIGKMLPQGLAVGITAEADKPVEAIDEMNEEVYKASENADLYDKFKGIKPPPPEDDDGGSGGFGSFVQDLSDKLDGVAQRMENLKVVMNTGQLVGATAPDMNNKLGEQMDLDERGL